MINVYLTVGFQVNLTHSPTVGPRDTAQ